MRILHAILSHEVYGSERFCAELAAAQSKQGAGHENDIRVLIKSSKTNKYANYFIQTVSTNNLVILPAWWPSVLDGWAARRIIRGFAPDVVHCHLGRAAQRVGRAALAEKVPTIASLHLGYKPKLYGHLHAIACVAKWQEATITGYHGIVTTIRNWVRPLPPATAAEIQALRTQLGIKSTHTVLGSVGRLNDQKGYDLLIPAFLTAHGHSSTHHLVIVGEGPQRPQLENLAQSHPRIHLVGFQSNMPAWWGLFNAFISSSRFEGLALVGLEALAQGLPMLLTNVPGNAELATLQAPNQIPLCEPNSIPALTTALQQFQPTPQTYNLTQLQQSHALASFQTLYTQLIQAQK